MPGWLKRETVEATSDTQTQISAFWEQLASVGYTFSPTLLDRVWVASRCLQLNSQQIGAMPLRFNGAPSSSEPAWVANPDPVWYPNGIGDAIFAATWSLYGAGDAFLYVTARYSSGLPSAWTVLDPWQITVGSAGGSRTYRSGDTPLDPANVVQITRNPTGALRGTSALKSYAAYAWGLLGSGELNRAMLGAGGSMPNAVLNSKKKLTQDQARSIQDAWVAARARAGAGVPPVLDPDLSFDQLSFSPADLLLLDSQQFDAKVITSAFGVPPFMLNLSIDGGLNYENPAMLFEVWWRTELRPAALKISRALSANMLPRGSWVEFDARTVLAPTFQDLVASWAALIEKGVVTVDEFRAAVLNLPPMDADGALEQLVTPPSAGASPSQNGNGNGSRPFDAKALRPMVMS